MDYLFTAHRSENGLLVTWRKGWEPLGTDDFGNTYSIFGALVRDWPHGSIATNPVEHDIH